jgi:hypothetical protein
MSIEHTMVTPAKPKTWREIIKRNKTLTVIFAFLALIGVGSLLPDPPPVEVSDITYSAINPSTIKVAWTMHGKPGDTVNCHVHATDQSHRYDGSDLAMDIELDETTGGRTSWIPLGINNNGAVWVTEVTVDC